MKLQKTLCCLAIAASFSLNAARLPARGANPAAGKGPKTPAVEPAVDPSWVGQSLATAAKDYQSDPNDATWAPVAEALRLLLSTQAVAKIDSSTLIRANPSLKELGVTVLEATPAKIWTFPKLTHCRAILVQWREVKAAAPVRRRGPVPAPVVSSKAQLLPLPSAVSLREVKIIDIAGNGEKKPKAAQPVASEKKGKPAETKPKGKDPGRYLILAGNDKASGTIWLDSYKLTAEGFRENSSPLSLIPPFLLKNISGKVAFHGPDLVLTIFPRPKLPAQGNAQSAVAELSTYKLALRLFDGRYALDGKATEDTPYNAVYQFLHAVQQGHIDVAKGWLIDPSLASIPKYIGLFTVAAAHSSRIINMSGAPAGIYRYRLITFEKNDLILDVTKAKTHWAIRSIFIAPPDPLLQKIARSLPAPPSETKPKEHAEATHGAHTKLPSDSKNGSGGLTKGKKN